MLLLLLLLQPIAAIASVHVRCFGNHTLSHPQKYLGHVVRDNAMLDHEHKILMDWTPKAACSRSVAMFFDHLGYRSGTHYSVETMPHTFRIDYSTKCGHSDGSYYTNPNWFRFKVVRNPFIRLVSSYFHILRHTLVRLTKAQRDAMSFADFVGEFEKAQGTPTAYSFAANHGAFQHQLFELVARVEQLPSPFHRIIHAERGHEEIVEMNAFLARRGNLGRPFNFTDVSFEDPREGDKKVDVKEFIGRRPYEQIKDLHPRNYAVMYDTELRQQVTRLLSWDLLLYNYSWPF